MENTQQSNPLKKKLEGKVVIVTGGASGIGEATARHFADHGARVVVIADIHDILGQSVAQSIGPHRSTYIHCDVTDEEQVKSMVDRTVQTYGALDIMFSNAGTISGSAQTVLDLDLSQFDTVMRVNTRGMAVCVKQAARKMVEMGTRGVIICNGSVSATRGGFTSTDYTMSKHAVLGLVRSASLQLGAHGIRVNMVSPSTVLTPLLGRLGMVSAGEVEGLMGPFTSLKGMGLKMEHVVEAVLFMASEESGFITGHNLEVDGGLISIPFSVGE